MKITFKKEWEHMNIQKNQIIKQIRYTKKFNSQDVKRLACQSLEYCIINLKDFQDIQDCLKEKNNLYVIAGFNILLYRAFRGFNDTYQKII